MRQCELVCEIVWAPKNNNQVCVRVFAHSHVHVRQGYKTGDPINRYRASGGWGVHVWCTVLFLSLWICLYVCLCRCFPFLSLCPPPPTPPFLPRFLPLSSSLPNTHSHTRARAHAQTHTCTHKQDLFDRRLDLRHQHRARACGNHLDLNPFSVRHHISLCP